MNLMAIAFFLSTAISLALTPGIGFMAAKAGVVDEPRGRHAHEKPVPLMGGLAIFIAFVATVLVRLGVNDWVLGLILGSGIIMLTGAIDDIVELKPLAKLAGQIIGAVAMVAMGVRMEFVSNPFGGILHLGWLSYPFSVIWILSFVNAVNLLDGLDGLAAGVVGIGSMSLGLIAYGKGHIDIALLSIILSGSCIGFLWHNFNPAQIFMGDTGALFIGAAMGGISAVGAVKGPATLTIAVPVVIMGVAVLDTALAIIRRVKNKISVGEGDRDHIHYWLIKTGLSQKQAVGIIYGLTMALSVAAYTISRQKSTPIGWFIAFSAFAVMIIAGAMAGMIKLGRVGRWMKERLGSKDEKSHGGLRDEAGHDKDDACGRGDKGRSEGA
jgi:UDP-GlcNAc:undecaprenyl-phosphate GlcNAc-1-phosphate transferase